MYPFPQNGPTVDPTLTHRRARSVVTLTDASGQPLRDVELTVGQRSHAFGFAATAFEFLPLVADELAGEELEATQRVEELWFETFNWGTLPFYWGRFEPQRGNTDKERTMATAKWLQERNVLVKGHPLVWHTVTAPWLDNLTVAEIEEAQRARIRRDVADFCGVIDMWDAINEVVIMPNFDKYPNGITRLCRELGRIETVRLAFDEARAANPDATLLINDFDLSFGYDALLEGVLAAGVSIDAVGLQTHMHQGYRGEEQTIEIMDRFARYGLPLHFTETTLVSGDLMPEHIVDLNDWQVNSWPSTPEGEERQADELIRHVRTLFSHPSVKAFTYWNPWDRGAWLGAPAGLINSDGSPKPSFEALRNLVRNEWWTGDRQVRTDEEGQFAIEGWKGTYAVLSGGSEAQFILGEDAVLSL